MINQQSPVTVQLSRNLVRQIKRGHAWVYPEALREIPKVPPGTPAILLDNRGGRQIAKGYLDPQGAIALRVCTTNNEDLDEQWILGRMQRALALRQSLFQPFTNTNAYRLFNGEGDGLPGLVCDIYNQAAVIQTDGPAPDHFYHLNKIAEWLAVNLGLIAIFHKNRTDAGSQVNQILGGEISQPVHFSENGLAFTADLVHGQKTGFFLDQRNNRALIQPLAAGKGVLNAFGYTGGFSIYAGKGGSEHVTTLDQAAPALEAAKAHWKANQLPEDRHETISEDAFDFLEKAVRQQTKWDLVILDPPSFAPSEAKVPQAVKAYTRLITLGAQVTRPNGLLAAASCSSHIHREQFLEIIEQAVSNARRTAAVLGTHGQPPDHPAPLVMPELDYLKFVLLQLD